MNVLVTGGAGYIGSHTCKVLAGAGHHPITFDNLSTGHRAATTATIGSTPVAATIPSSVMPALISSKAILERTSNLLQLQLAPRSARIN